jgi:hypothetical protein
MQEEEGMTRELLFSQPAYIEIQGPSVLDLLDRTIDTAYYQVQGFSSPRLFITDYRKDVNSILDRTIETDDFSHFAYSFSCPSQLDMERLPSGDYSINLYSTEIVTPIFMVWLVVGLEGEYPTYPYFFQEVQTLEPNTFAGITIYPLEAEKMQQFIEISQNASAL